MTLGGWQDIKIQAQANFNFRSTHILQTRTKLVQFIWCYKHLVLTLDLPTFCGWEQSWYSSFDINNVTLTVLNFRSIHLLLMKTELVHFLWFTCYKHIFNFRSSHLLQKKIVGIVPLMYLRLQTLTVWTSDVPIFCRWKQSWYSSFDVPGVTNTV